MNNSKKNSQFIVINVDDLGLHPAVFRAAQQCAAAGTVSSATILANGKHFQDIHSIDGVGYGVHLNILRGSPILDSHDVGTLVNEQGFFTGDYKKLYLKYLFGRIQLNQVFAEWDAQIAKVKESGFTVTHLDSEKHVHCWPALMEIACSLATRHGIRWVRRPTQRLLMSDFLSPKLLLLNAWAAQHRPVANTQWPNSVWGIADQGKKLRVESLLKYLKANRGAHVIELCCHPGIPLKSDPPLPKEFGNLFINQCWEAEASMLLQGDIASQLQEEGWTISNYGKI